MKSIQKRTFLAILGLALSTGLISAAVKGNKADLAVKAAADEIASYYSNVDFSKTGAALKTSLFNTIGSHTEIGYDGLWTAYQTTDVRDDGTIWDMYSNKTHYSPTGNKCGNYSGEGSCFNREHSVPKSWFSEGRPMYSDLFHLVPTDGYVNGRRSNYPFGTVGNATYTSNGGFSKLGSCNYPGYSGTVFEPNDEYKGDFARIYFYFVTAYEDKVASFNSSGTNLGGNKYPGLNSWSVSMFLEWAKNDPVSQKEIDRNNAVYEIQGNRNPFVDYADAAEAVFGTGGSPIDSSVTTSGPVSSSKTSSSATSSSSKASSSASSISYASVRTIEASDLDTLYPTSASVRTSASGVSFTVMNVANFNAFQFKKNGSYLYNNDDLGEIESIDMTITKGTLDVFASSTKNGLDSQVSPSGSHYRFPAGNTYFTVRNSSANVATIDAITINYKTGGTSSSSSSSSISSSSATISTATSSSSISSSVTSSSSSTGGGSETSGRCLGTYKLVTDTSEITSGTRYVFTTQNGAGEAIALGERSSTSNAMMQAVASISESGTIEVGSDSSINPLLITKESDGTWSVFDEMTQLYVTCIAKLTESSEVSSWSEFSINSDGTALLGSSSLALRYNASMAYFRGYKTASCESVYAFKYVEDPTAMPSAKIKSFASNFTDTVSAACGNAASDVPSPQLLAAWASSYEEGDVASFSQAERSWIRNVAANSALIGEEVADALRLYDFIMGKYGAEAFASVHGNYLDRNVERFSKPNVLDNGSDGNGLSLALAISVAAISLLGASVFFLFKRKAAR